MYVSLHKIYWWCNISIVKLSVKSWPLLLPKQTFLSIKILLYMNMTLDLRITILLMDSSSAMTLFLNCPEFKTLIRQLTTHPSNLRAILEKNTITRVLPWSMTSEELCLFYLYQIRTPKFTMIEREKKSFIHQNKLERMSLLKPIIIASK